jgi:hypothetical protein
VQWSGSLTPALAPTVDSYAPGTTPNGGYLPLSIFSGIGPIAGVGDDTMTNFNVPTFYYAGEPYSRVGVGSNGTLVIGGATSGADATALPQTFPDPTRPNNVIAPLWTDMNPPAGGTLRIGLLSGGGNSWIVIDWERVKNFNGSTTHSFEIWLRRATGTAGTGPSSEEISVEYGSGADAANAASGDSGTGVNWGAENRNGTSGANAASAPADGTSYRVMTSPPVPGGSVTIPFDVVSPRQTGTFHSDASLTSDQTPGSTIAPQTVTVTP